MKFEARLRGLLSECSERLISARARSRIEAAGAPFAETDAECALECHAKSERVDLVVRVDARDRDVLLARGGMTSRVAAFFARWADPAGPLHRIPFVELEHDLDRDHHDAWIGPAIEPLVRRSVVEITSQRDGVARGLALAVMRELGEARDPWHARVGAIFDRLPPRGCINHFTLGAVRPGSEREFVRAIASLARPDVSRFLADVGWRGDLERLDGTIRRYFPGEARIDLDLDIDLEGCAPRTALYADFRAPRARDSTLRTLLARIAPRNAPRNADDDLVDRDAVDALHAWILRVDGTLSRVMTLKIVDDGRARWAKAYLGALREVS